MYKFASDATRMYDGVPQVVKPPSDILTYGFIPHSSQGTGSPMVAQWFNYLFQTITEAFPTYYNITGSSVTIAPNDGRTRKYTYWRVQIVPYGNSTASSKMFFIDTSSVSNVTTNGHVINVYSNGTFNINNTQNGWKLILEPLGFGN